MREIVAAVSWLEGLLRTPEATGRLVAGVISAFVGGVLTICAALLSVYTFLRQQRSQRAASFLQWLASFHSDFHNDKSFALVRERLAEDRAWVRRQVCAEMCLLDGLTPWDDLIESDQRYFRSQPLAIGDAVSWIDWQFVRRFTDYLYFFEEILAFGEYLWAGGSRREAAALVNHFGWFLRSLCCCWASELESLATMAVFVRYLALNRYPRLAEVALLMFLDCACSDRRAAPDQDARAVAQGVLKILHAQQGREQRPPSVRRVRAKWSRLVGGRGIIRH